MVMQILGNPGEGSPARPEPAAQLAQVAAGLVSVMPGGPLAIVLWVAVLAGLAWTLSRLHQPQSEGSLLVTLLSVAALEYALWPVPVDTYYLYVLVPVPFLLVGVSLAAAWPRSRPLAFGLAGVLTLATATGALTTGALIAGQPPNSHSLGNLKAQIAAVDEDAGEAPYATRLVSLYSDFGFHDAPYRYLFDHLLGAAPFRADVPTFVIFDSPELAPNAGRPVGGATYIRFEPPTTGEDLIANGNFNVCGSLAQSWSAPAIDSRCERDASGAYLRIERWSQPSPPPDGPAVKQTVRVPRPGRYLLAFEYRAPSGGAEVFGHVRDAGGAVVVTYFAQGIQELPTFKWTPASFFVDVPSGSSEVEVSLANPGSEAVDFRDVSFRPVTSPPIPGVPVR